jgi:hypothetical protein
MERSYHVISIESLYNTTTCLEVMAIEDMRTIIGKAVTDKRFLDELCRNLDIRDTDRASTQNFLRNHATNLDEKELEYFLSNRQINICQCLRMLQGCLAIEYDEATAQKRQ